MTLCVSPGVEGTLSVRVQYRIRIVSFRGFARNRDKIIFLGIVYCWRAGSRVQVHWQSLLQSGGLYSNDQTTFDSNHIALPLEGYTPQHERCC
jgi:hypothetical protein